MNIYFYFPAFSHIKSSTVKTLLGTSLSSLLCRSFFVVHRASAFIFSFLFSCWVLGCVTSSIDLLMLDPACYQCFAVVPFRNVSKHSSLSFTYFLLNKTRLCLYFLLSLVLNLKRKNVCFFLNKILRCNMYHIFLVSVYYTMYCIWFNLIVFSNILF